MGNQELFFELREQVLAAQYPKLNDMQKEAVLSTEGPLLVLAGAGSGKTTVIVNRIAQLVQYGMAGEKLDWNVNVDGADIDALKAYLENGADVPPQTLAKLAVNPPRPWQILAITFTNKAAAELKARLAARLGDGAQEIWASTFHSCCVRILRRYAQEINHTSNFTIYDMDDSKRVIKEALRNLSMDEKHFTPKEVQGVISRAKDQLLTPKAFLEENASDYRLRKIGEVYREYRRILRQVDAMDFDDLIFNTVRLLERSEEARNYYQNRFRYVLVDEYQDTNLAQYRLTALLAGKYNNLCVVGDDDQSIYKFRGATVENILSFEQKYRGAKVIRLEENYRSTEMILDAANAVIANNRLRKGKNLWTSKQGGAKITVLTAQDDREEGRFIAQSVLNAKAEGKKWSDHAVLYRMNNQSNAIEEALVRSGVPYRVIGGHRFYERKEIKDALAYLTVLNNPADIVRLRRIINEPKRGLGETTMSAVMDIASEHSVSAFSVMQTAEQYPALSRSAAKLKAFAAMLESLRAEMATLKLHELLQKTLSVSGYMDLLAADKEAGPDRAANLSELSNNLLRYQNENEDGDLNGFLQEVALLADIDNYNTEADTVVLMTMHSAKGLEFPTVFIAGVEENIFPGRQAMYEPSELEEERRLAYVGITRAKERLYLCTAETRMLFGSFNHNPPSRFIREIPQELLEEQEFGGRRAAPQQRSSLAGGMGGAGGGRQAIPPKKKPASAITRAPAAKAPSFGIGDTVVHKTFGTGVILSVRPMGNDAMLEIAFSRAGTKKLMANYAKLEKAE